MRPGFDPAAMRARLDSLREIIREDQIFVQAADGRLMLSPLAAQKLAEMDLKTAELWRDEHREEASALAARVIEIYQSDTNPPIVLRGSRCDCNWPEEAK